MELDTCELFCCLARDCNYRDEKFCDVSKADSIAQGCHEDFKLPGKYNKWAGNQTARDFFSSIFLLFSSKSSWGPLS